MEELLSILECDSRDNAKRCYHRLCLKYHPDKNNSQEAKEKFQQINEAYDILSDDNKLDNYLKEHNEKLKYKEQIIQIIIDILGYLPDNQEPEDLYNSFIQKIIHLLNYNWIINGELIEECILFFEEFHILWNIINTTKLDILTFLQETNNKIQPSDFMLIYYQVSIINEVLELIATKPHKLNDLLINDYINVFYSFSNSNTLFQ